MGLLALKVAAVLLHAVHGNHMVGPLPDTAADQLGIAVKQLIVVIHIAGAVAHGVGIFTQEHRHVDIVSGGKTLHVAKR